MFVDATRRRNPKLIEATVELHRAGRIPSNCYVVDVDAVAANARAVSAAASAHGLTAYQMTKQFGRNPVVAHSVARSGIEKVVAVDFEEARVLHRHGLRMGHLGHLVQVPFAELANAVAMEPEVVTVFGFEQAERLAEAARAAGREQPVLVRVVCEGDVYYAAQKGGVPIDELVDVAKRIDALDGIRVGGVTSFPCVLFDEEARELRPTSNLTTIAEAARMLRDAGMDAAIVNAPSASCSATAGMLAEHGATHIEPGSCLTGHTPLHAVTDQPEIPAMVYVSEVTHILGDTVYSLGGGFYPRSRARSALIYGRGKDEPVTARVELDPAEAIDYYGNLYVDDLGAVSVGDTVLYAFRSQVFVSRCFVAVLANVATEPRLLGVFDRAGFPLGDDLLPTTAPLENS
ncbi:amino-acid racemase [Sphaerisporangium rufum]|uniref:Amino-acid racemase n=1 Tax=Sphaerisporangium rufum TaxID=1381558 RepID=A0A919R8X3_9ACTN|nr:alanine racemase [Sphaerisporangium rufum]GII81827.1 amino-acid racemase [Sphaerisporangium rufum]